MKNSCLALCVLSIVFNLFFPVISASAQGQDPASLVKQGDTLLFQSDFSGAEKAYSAAIEVSSDYAAAYAHRCYLRTFLAHMEDALADCQKAVALAPNNAEGYVYLTRAYDWSSEFEKAVEVGKQAITLDSSNGLGHSFLGEALLDANQIDDGESEVRLGVQLAPDLAEPHRDVAYMYLVAGQNKDALAEMESAVSIAPNFVIYQEELAGWYSDSGDDQQALEHYQKALAIRKQISDYDGQGWVLVYIGQIYYYEGQYQKALEYFSQAEALIQKIDDQTELGSIYNSIGGDYLNLGKYQAAIDYLLKALTIRQGIDDQEGIGRTLNNLGGAYDNLGQYEKALQYYLRALTIRQQVDDPQGEGTTLNNIGAIYLALGQREKALNYMNQALAIFQRINDQLRESVTLSNIAKVYDEEGKYEQALETYQQALSIAQAAKDRSGEGVIQNNIGEIYINQGKYQTALDYFEKALNIFQEIGGQDGELRSLAGLGNIQSNLKQYDKALAYYQKALEIGQKTGDRSGTSVILENIGAVYEKMAEIDQSINFYRRSIDTIESIRRDIKIEELKTSYVSASINSYEHLVGLLWKEKRYDEAFNYVERARARSFLDQLAGGAIDFQIGAPSESLKREQELRSEIDALRQQLVDLRNNQPTTEEGKKNIANVESDLESRQAEYAQLLTEIKIQSPEAASLVSVDVATLADIQNLLDRDTTLVEYYVTEDQTLAFILTHNTFETVTINVSRSDLTQAVTVSQDFRNLNDPHLAELKQLYTWLITPLKDKLKTPLVGIIPHGILHYLSFAALTIDGKDYFGNDYVLFSLPSASTLRFIQAKRKSVANTILALGKPTITEPGLAPLRFAQEEATTITNMYSSKPFIGDAATETILKKQAENAGIIHLAAHGAYNKDNPLFSTIYLAPDGENDGNLEVHEIYGLNLTKSTDLIVLSACQTDIGAISTGDEVVGLTRAFIYAGSPTVIASLWVVNDKPTALLMERFYTHLREGIGKAQALQIAQNEVRTQYPNPHDWAAFTLTGDPGLVSEKKGGLSRQNIALLLAGLLVTIVIIYILMRKRNQHDMKTSFPDK